MNSDKTLSINRVALLIRRHLIYNLKTYLIGFAALSSILIIISLLNTLANGNLFSEEVFVNLGEVFLFIGGLLLTSNIFKEISSKHRGWLYMMLPANPSEKILSYWLLTTIGYTIISSLTLVISSIIVSSLSTLIFKTSFYIFNPFNSIHLTIVLHYCIVQSMFFFGAIVFQKNNFLKTILSLFALQFMLSIIAGIILYLLFGSMHLEATDLQLENDYFFTTIIPIGTKIFYFGIMVPFFLTVSYFKFKEREV